MHWTLRRLLIIGGALLLVGAPSLVSSPPGKAQPIDALDWREAPTALHLELYAVTNEIGARFTWHVDKAVHGVVCYLDADGDGEFEHTIERCAARSSLVHHYREPGVFFVTMTAHSGDGRTGRAVLRVDFP